MGVCNEAGVKMLEFCALNGLTAMNTMFEKKQVHMATWKHPATKQDHMIDVILMRKEQRKLCCDVRACRSACCWSDRHLVRGKLQIYLPKRSKATNQAPLAVHRLSNKECREQYQERLNRLLDERTHCEDETPEATWTTLKECILESAEECVGCMRKKQPDKQVSVDVKSEVYRVATTHIIVQS